MSNKYSGKKNVSYKKSRFNWLLLPVLFVVAIVPLVVHSFRFDTWLSGYDFFSSEVESVDFFLAGKMWSFVAASAAMLCLLVYKLIKDGKQIKFSKIYFPLAGYALLALLSSIFSEYSYFAFAGINEQFESVFALLGYCLVAYYCFLVVTEEKDVNLILWFLACSTAVILLIGMSQAWFTDFYKTSFAKYLILSPSLWDIGEFKFEFEEGRVYLTLYNPNYVGSYASLLSPIFLMAIFYAKKVWQKAAFGVLFVGVLLALIGSLSRAGFVGVIFGLILIFVLFLKKIKKYWMPMTIVLVIVVGTIYTMNNYTNGAFLNRFVGGFSVTESEKSLESIETNDEDVVIHYKGEELALCSWFDRNTNQFSASAVDASGNPVYYTLDGDSYYYYTTDERFSGIQLALAQFTDDIFGMVVRIDGVDWYFSNEVNDGTYYYYSRYGKFTKLVDSPSVEWLIKRGSAASGRGFIWAKTLPLLKDKILLGSGADTYQLVFPNTDYVALNNYGYLGQVITKPHNLYLQIGVQTGVLSLVCVIAFYLMYFIWSLKIYFKQKGTKLRFIGMGILAGTFGYMVVGIINDSTITVAPLFWTMIGVGMAINSIVAHDLATNADLLEIADVEIAAETANEPADDKKALNSVEKMTTENKTAENKPEKKSKKTHKR